MESCKQSSLSSFIEKQKDDRPRTGSKEEDTEAAIVTMKSRGQKSSRRGTAKSGDSLSRSKQEGIMLSRSKEETPVEYLNVYSNRTLSIMANDFAEFLFPVSRTQNDQARRLTGNKQGPKANQQKRPTLSSEKGEERPTNRNIEYILPARSLSTNWSEGLSENHVFKSSRKMNVDPCFKPAMLPMPRSVASNPQRKTLQRKPSLRNVKMESLRRESHSDLTSNRFRVTKASNSNASIDTTCCSSTDVSSAAPSY